MIFKGTDDPLCCNASVDMGREKLEVYVVIAEGVLDVRGTSVVHNVQVWILAISFEDVVYFFPSVCKKLLMLSLPPTKDDNVALLDSVTGNFITKAAKALLKHVGPTTFPGVTVENGEII